MISWIPWIKKIIKTSFIFVPKVSTYCVPGITLPPGDATLSTFHLLSWLAGHVKKSLPSFLVVVVIIENFAVAAVTSENFDVTAVIMMLSCCCCPSHRRNSPSPSLLSSLTDLAAAMYPFHRSPRRQAREEEFRLTSPPYSETLCAQHPSIIVTREFFIP